MPFLVRIFHYTALAEGWSYLLLLGVGMPLKYAADWEYGVKALGMPHGVLFILYCLLLAWFFFQQKLSFAQSIWGFVASLIPFGTFFFDRTIKKIGAEPEASQP